MFVDRSPYAMLFIFFFSSRRRHTRLQGDWSSDVCLFRSPPTSVAIAGVPVIATDVGGVPEMLTPEEAAFVPPEHPAALEIGRASCRKECRSRWSPYH